MEEEIWNKDEQTTDHREALRASAPSAEKLSAFIFPARARFKLKRSISGNASSPKNLSKDLWRELKPGL